ncbi:MAG: thioredoxin family protein [Rikenellaceae bacterium]|nr:thioredoxin family protein [Rikenellaceae bacterium]
MQRLRNIFIILSLCLMAAMAHGQTDVVKWSAATENNPDGTVSVRFTADIEAGWHIYDMQEYDLGPTSTSVTVLSAAGLEPVGRVTEVTRPTRKFDELFDTEIGYHEGRAVLEQRVRVAGAAGTLEVEIEWMACDDRTCLAPQSVELTVTVPANPAAGNGASGGAAAVSGSTGGNGTADGSGAASGPSGAGEAGAGTADGVGAGFDGLVEDSWLAAFPDAEQGAGGLETAEFRQAADPLGGSLWRIILAAMKWALAAILTPCVFPMIPMTVSFFMKEGTSKAGSRFRALMYGFFIVAIYTVPIATIILITRFLGGETVTSDIFNWLSTHWLPNILFFLIFMFFAASFFGAFELNLPSWLVTKSDSKSEKGGLAGVFFMALTLVLVSFSCTVPIVGSALTEATSGGNWLRPIIAILSYSVVFAMPFTLFAFFPSWMEKLPRSGGWLNSVKVVLGFVEVALGLKFLSVADQTYHWGILDREIYLAIWIAVFSLMGAYLLGKIKFKHDSDVKYIGVGRLALVIATFTFVVYLIPGMFGAPLKGISGYLPPMHTQDFVAGGTAVRSADGQQIRAEAPLYGDFLHLPHGLEGFFDLDQAQAYADRVGKPLFVDVTGHGCVNCREMEARVWSDARVLELLREEFVIVALYVDDKKNVPEDKWVTTPNGRTLKSLGKINAYRAMQLYGTNAQPLYIIQGRGGRVLAGPRGYDLNVENFIAFLREGLDRYRAL